MKPLLIDVIVPIYNGERFIDTLISNFERQTFRDFRVIIVNDGSTDRTSEILDQKLNSVSFTYAVFHQDNKGLPSARNAGLRFADADWVAFVDCDDILHKEYLAHLHQAVASSNELVGICSHKQVLIGQPVEADEESKLAYTTFSSASIMRSYYVRDLISPCTTIIKLDWLKENELFFDEECPYLEDGPFMTRIFAYSSNIVVLENTLYYYVSHGPSLVSTSDPEKYMVAYKGFQRVEDELSTVSNESTRTFEEVAHARYILILLRRAARQLSLYDFSNFASKLPLKQYAAQLKHQPLMRKTAAWVFLFSPKLFYYGIRALQ